MPKKRYPFQGQLEAMRAEDNRNRDKAFGPRPEPPHIVQSGPHHVPDRHYPTYHEIHHTWPA